MVYNNNRKEKYSFYKCIHTHTHMYNIHRRIHMWETHSGNRSTSYTCSPAYFNTPLKRIRIWINKWKSIKFKKNVIKRRFKSLFCETLFITSWTERANSLRHTIDRFLHCFLIICHWTSTYFIKVLLPSNPQTYAKIV